MNQTFTKSCWWFIWLVSLLFIIGNWGCTSNSKTKENYLDVLPDSLLKKMPAVKELSFKKKLEGKWTLVERTNQIYPHPNPRDSGRFCF